MHCSGRAQTLEEKNWTYKEGLKQYLGQQREKYEVLGETVVIKYVKGKEKINIPASRSFEGRTNSKDLIFFPVLKLRINVRNKVLKVRSIQQ